MRVRLKNSRDFIVSWEVPRDPSGSVVNYTAKFHDSRRNTTVSCSVPHQDFVERLSCEMKDLSYEHEYELSVICCIAPNEDGNGGGCSFSSMRAFRANVQGSKSCNTIALKNRLQLHKMRVISHSLDYLFSPHILTEGF